MENQNVRSIKISGAGVIDGGFYDEVTISGGAKVRGDLHCNVLKSSGGLKLEGHLTAKVIKGSGGTNICGDVKSEAFNGSGGTKIDGDLNSTSIKASGSMKVKKNINCDQALTSGNLEVEGDLNAEMLEHVGSCAVRGLMNVGNLHLKMNGPCTIGEIGAEKVHIERDGGSGYTLNINFIHTSLGTVCNCPIIEGDDIDIEYTKCNTVRGKKVRIGKGCEIKVVEYSETLDIAKDAIVEKECRV